MPILNLTDITVRSLPPGLYMDAKTPSFGIRVGKNRKTWIVLREPNRTKVRLGHYPALSLAEARKRAFTELGKQDERKTILFTEARQRFLEAHLPTLRPRSAYQINRTLTKYFHWNTRLGDITHEDVAKAIDRIKAKSERSHALKDIKTFFNWCVPRLVAHSPANGIKGAPYRPRERLLTDAEIKLIWRACDDLDWYGALVQMLILTGQRVGQFVVWDHAWVKDGSIVFPAGVMKGDSEHRIPLPKMAEQVLPRLERHTYQGKRKRQIDERSGVTDWVLHDIRRYFSSTHARLKTDIVTTEAMLHHVSGTRSPIQRVYDLYDRYQEMLDATDAYEQHLVTVLK